ncbi:CACTA en-spm transposon protein [Cucumis melo var. makuwa]|uniref:CACTA en-spm transposon protein n=1 Tax=Cucumis melo var. makuwa TaxID=1194695 RepID=A0A5A7U7G7_CUCMM|nr:CACTA en-spm transposon protein [Cucumis melo var. makuwa]TYJ97920.1 CACTA en-spm transposon protein [Cucumis melo var. makuwa]
MLSAWKEFRGENRRHFKKFRNLEQARANPPLTDWTNKPTRTKQPYSHSSGSKLFLQRKYELTEQRGQPVDHVELFRETNANRSGQFVSQAAANMRNNMLELQSQPTLEYFQPLSRDEICETVFGRQWTTQKVLVGAPSQVPKEYC